MTTDTIASRDTAIDPAAGPRQHRQEDHRPDGQAEALAALKKIEAARRAQLASLETTSLDEVSAGYRESVERILAEVCAARRRAEAGLHGICAVCDDQIHPDRIEARPWATTCTACTRRWRP